jgi:hypothetical protein
MSHQFEELDEYCEISLETFPLLILERMACLYRSATGSRFRELVAGFGNVFDFLIPA